MARQQKQTVDYFPHYADASQRKTLTILQSKYGDTGYAVWFRLLETLAASDGHYIRCSLSVDWEYLTRRLIVEQDKATEILKTLVELEAIDKELWEQKRIIWSDNFAANIAEVYRNRRRELPQKPCENGNLRPNYTQSTENLHAQSRVEESRVEETKLEETRVEETPQPINQEKIKNIKSSYGEGGLVKLTQVEYQKLLSKFGEKDLDKRINKLATYIGGHDKKYKSHYMTILNWALNDDDKNNGRKSAADVRASKVISSPTDYTKAIKTEFK